MFFLKKPCELCWEMFWLFNHGERHCVVLSWKDGCWWYWMRLGLFIAKSLVVWKCVFTRTICSDFSLFPSTTRTTDTVLCTETLNLPSVCHPFPGLCPPFWVLQTRTAFIETIPDSRVDICHSCVTMEIRALLCKIPVCVNPVFTMACSTVHLNGDGGQWICTKAKAVCLYLFVFFRHQLITGNIIRSDAFSLRPTWVQIHMWGSQHRVTRLLFAVLAPGGIQASAVLNCDCLHRPQWYLLQQRAFQCFSCHIVFHYTDGWYRGVSPGGTEALTQALLLLEPQTLMSSFWDLRANRLN